MPQAPAYRCPICESDLNVQQHESASLLKCANNHSFDFAKEGYVNLLPVQQKKSLQPGDDKNMVMARREFLQLGHYDFLRQKLINICLTLLPEDSSSRIVDLGCGEGYYTNELQTVLNDASSQASNERANDIGVYGVDISKPAVKYAAKRNKDVHYAVATNAHLPFSDHAIDLIVNVFAPLVGKECKRLLTPSGSIISVAPGPSHLFELKEAIYQSPEKHDEPTPPEHFVRHTHWQICEKVEIKTYKHLSDLLTMTPFGWKANDQVRQVLEAQLPLAITFDFVISQYRPDEAS